MNNDWSDFCEGDSGVIFTSHIGMPVTRLAVNDGETPMARNVSVSDFVNEIAALGNDTNNTAEIRLAAFELVWKITLDRMNYNDPTLDGKIDD